MISKQPHAQLEVNRPRQAPPRVAPGSERRPARWWSVLKLLLTVLVWAAVAAGGYYAYRELPGFLARRNAPPPKAAPRPVPVVTATAHTGDMQLYLTALGTVNAFNTVTIRSRVDGELIKVAFSEGQTVKQGQLLAEIDPRPYEVALAEAEGQLAKDEAGLQNAQLDLKRYRSLESTRVVTQQQMDLQLATVKQAAAAVKTDEAMIDNAKLQLSYCTITAPISGRIGLRGIDRGNLVHANDTEGLAVITQLQPIAVVFTIPQDDIPQIQRRLKTGETLTVEAYDRELTQRLAAGVLSAIDNQVDSSTGTLRLKAGFKNEDNLLFPNQFVNVRLHVDTQTDATIIPTAAVQRGPDMTFVYVVKKDSTVELRNVQLGPSEGSEVCVTSGLAPGEVLVTEGVDKLRPGSEVSLPAKQTAQSKKVSTAAGDPSSSAQDGSKDRG
jgi:multidrug efflux system membrane fusion protein